MEIKKEVKTFLVYYECTNCETGKLRPETMLMCNPPKWVHECTECGKAETFTVKYPYTTYEYVG